MRKIYFLLLTVLFAATHANAQTTLINPTGDGGFENGATFAANGWTVVNGAINQWFVGTVAVPSAGTNSAYMSDNVAGTTYNYLITGSSTVHFYRDVTFPAGETNIVLSFKWKGQGEGSFDYVTVYSMPTSVTPVVNIPAGGGSSWLNIPTAYPGAVIHCAPPNLNLQSAYQTQTICLPAAYAGTTRRLVFMWSNDGSVGTEPPGSIDEISLVSSVASAPANQPTGLLLTSFSTGQINGSFTAAAGAPDGYLTVRYPAGAVTTAPVNGTTYAAGNTLGLGKVVSSSAATTFNATGLSPSTTYDFYVYSYSTAACSAGPLYRTVSPLSGTQSTLACSPLAAGTYTVGPTGTYASLTAVTSAIAAGTAGPVIFELQPTYLSTVETFPITFGAVACPLTGGVTIRPQTGAVGLSITSADATGTINFNGGSNITIDGRAGGAGPSQLTISNTSLTGYTIHLINSASSNTFKYCTIAGVNTGATSGVIFFDNAVGLPTGNSNNTIDNCDIRDGATTPQNLIYASGNTTDYASGNNNNTISSCLLHDWFNATSIVASAAIRLFAGSSDWTITGNSFYQSVTRTFTMVTATDQSAINITSATFGNNFTITNNFIGGSAPLCGGAAWTYTGVATGTPTAKMISLTAAPVATFNTISGNTIQNISVTTATTNNLSGLILHAGGNVNITNNTLGSQTATGNVTFTLTNATAGVFYLPLGFGLGAAPVNVNVTNNNIGGITVANSSTGSCSFRVVYGQPVAGSQITINNNLIGGTVANSIQQLTNNIFTGILMLNPSVGGVYTNNTIRNMTLTNAGVTGSIRGIDVQASGGGHAITGNTIFNLTTNGTNVAINNAASIVGITMTGSAVGGTNVSGNTIYNLTNTNTTVAGWINGMYFATSASLPMTIISKNFVHSINLASTLNTAGMAGIFLPNVGFARVSNNMVRLGIDAAGASITNGLQINGIYKASTATMSIYHNSVYIGGTGVATGTASTYAFRRGTSGATQDTVMNNIFYNARSNASGTGKHYAINTNAATVLFSNYNDLLANGTGGVLAINGVTDYATLALWRTATNQDWNSVSGDPQYVNPTGTSATVDLHIGAGATPIEQAGYNLTTVTDDFDAQARAGLTPVDLGADAGNFTVSDIAPPVIYLTPLLINTCSTGDRAVNGINITDATGVPTAGALSPRIYYRKGAGAWFSQPGTLASGTATNGLWNFTIVAADMGGLVIGDVVSYYIIAQDIVATPNIASNFGGAIATDVNTVTTQPTTPNTYTVSGVSLSGTYTVGVGGAYTTLTAAVAAYNSACLAGPVLFSLIDAAYAGETFPIIINANPYASSVNTLTIKPTQAATTITGTSATGLIVLNGADWVTIDGSTSATVNTVCPAVAASRNLTLTQTNAATTSAVIWLQSTAAFDAATNNTIKNINLVGNSNTTTFAGVGSGNTTISTASLGFGNINNSYINNNISKTQYGIFSQGHSLSLKNTGTIINQNLINTVAPNNTARGGIVTGFENGIIISGNNISEIALTSSPDVHGIAMGSISISTSTFTGNEVTNATVTKNTIGSVRNTGTFSAAGIFVATALSGTNLIANNMISGVSANGTSGDFSVGIYIGGGTGTTQVYYNTVTMTSVPANTGSSDKSYALAIAGANPMVDIRNNILLNTQNNGTGTDYAIGFGYTAFTNLTSDHNDYYVTPGGTPFFIAGTGSISAPTNQSTVANLQAVTFKDGFAQNALPVFVSATDLHLSTAAGANWCLNGTGTAGPGISVSDDIDCQARNFPPDIGADDFVATSAGDIATPASQTVCSGTAITTIVLSGGASSYSWTRDNTVAATGIAANGTGNISGTLNNTTTSPVTVTFTITPLNANGCASPSGTFTATVTVTPDGTLTLTSAPGTDNQTVCINTPITPITYAVGGSGTGGSVSGLPAGVTGSFATGVITISGTPSVSGTFNYTVTTTGPCVTPTANGTITVTADATITLTSGAGTNNQTVCINSPIVNITYAVGGSGTGGSVSGLPAGVTGSFATGVITISGTPTVTGTFNYTVNTTGPCVTPSAGGTITVNPLPVITPTIVQPTTCVSFDGSITLVISGAAGPFNFAWTGSGVNPTSQNQTGLAVGNYSVTVTDANTGCFATANFLLLGPGGCSICPTIPTETASPSPVCKDSTVTLTASGLTDMGVTYGIEFKYSLTNIADPYTGGTSIGIVANGSLTGGGTIATLNTTFPVAGNYIVYAVLSPTPLDPACRPKDSVLLTVNPTPTAVATPASQTICSAATITTIVLSGTGTTFNWTRDNTVTVTGIAASGSGNISGALTNTTNAPITVTFTITPVANGCPGLPITATVLVNPTPNAVATPASQTICSAGTITTIVLSGAVAGTTFNWTRDNTVTVTGIAASGSGNISGALTNTTNAPVTVTFTITPTANSCPGAPITASVLVNPTPNAVATPSSQTVCSGVAMTTIVLSGNVTGTTYNWTRDNQVNVTGIPNSGSGNISGTPINNTVVQQTVTFTITPTANGCPGAPITATLIVNKAPVITCPANITVNNTPGQCGAIVNYPPATATGAPAPVITYSQASGTFFRVGTTTVTCTATNICGTVSCTFTITVVDNEPPVITCPANITTNNNPGLCSAVVNYPLPTVTDNCCLPGAIALTQTASQTPVAGSVACNAGGFHTNNSYWRAYDLSAVCLSGPLTINTVQFGIELADANGTGTTQPVTVNVYTSAGAFPGGVRTLIASQTVQIPDQTLSLFTVNLTTPPTVPVNAILVLELFTPDGRAPANNRFFIGSNASAQSGPSYISAADCGLPNPTNLATLGFPNMHIILNANGIAAGANPITQIAGLPSGSAFPVGVTTNTFRATDASGNTSTCSFTVTVVDAQAPTITCPGNITVTSPVGSCTAVVTYAVTATDNCPGVTTALVSGLASGSAFPVGVTTVTWRATDAAGNTSTCSFTVTVLDGQLPVITGQPTNQTVCVGTNAVFSVTATNVVSYQWQAWNGTAWANIAGANASTLTLNAVTFTMNTNSYRVIINGLCTINIISGFATLSVNQLPTVSILASIPPVLLPGQLLTLTAVVSPGGGSYQWFKNGVAIAGATGASLVNLTVSDIGSYRVRYTDLNGCISNSADLVVSGQTSDNVFIYPNPNNGHFHVRVYNQANEEITIRVFDMKGTLVYLKKAITGIAYTDIEVEISSDRIIAAETYLVEVRGNNGRLIGTKKIQILQ